MIWFAVVGSIDILWLVGYSENIKHQGLLYQTLKSEAVPNVPHYLFLAKFKCTTRHVSVISPAILLVRKGTITSELVSLHVEAYSRRPISSNQRDDSYQTDTICHVIHAVFIIGRYSRRSSPALPANSHIIPILLRG